MSNVVPLPVRSAKDGPTGKQIQRRQISRSSIEGDLVSLVYALENIGRNDALARDAAVVVRAVALALLHRRTESFRATNKSERGMLVQARALLAGMPAFVDRERPMYLDRFPSSLATIVECYSELLRRIEDGLRKPWDEMYPELAKELPRIQLFARCLAKEASSSLALSPSLAPLGSMCPVRFVDQAALAERFAKILHDHGDRFLEAAKDLRKALLTAAGVRATTLANWRAEEARPRLMVTPTPP
jgi:hypothetical protein